MAGIKTFFKEIFDVITTLNTGVKLTLKHFVQAKNQREPLGVDNQNYFNQQNGLFTTLYPHESLPIPDNGRNRLHNEIDDCIVCDLCAKICPVDCIEIEPIKSTEEIGKTSDGSSKRIYAAKFDIDMGKCCYCGLCTTVCPTECLTMTNAYDYSEFDIKNMIYNFTDLTPEQAIEKQKIYDEAQLLKAKAKEEKQKESQSTSVEVSSTEQAKKPFKPLIKRPTENTAPIEKNEIVPPTDEISKPSEVQNKLAEKTDLKTIKPIIKLPTTAIKPKIDTTDNQKIDGNLEEPKPKPIVKPTFKPVIKVPPKKDNSDNPANDNV